MNIDKLHHKSIIDIGKGQTLVQPAREVAHACQTALNRIVRISPETQIIDIPWKDRVNRALDNSATAR